MELISGETKQTAEALGPVFVLQVSEALTVGSFISCLLAVLTPVLNRQICHKRFRLNCIVPPPPSVKDTECQEPLSIKQDVLAPDTREAGYRSTPWEIDSITENAFHFISRVILIGMLRNSGAITTRL